MILGERIEKLPLENTSFCTLSMARGGMGSMSSISQKCNSVYLYSRLLLQEVALVNI